MAAAALLVCALALGGGALAQDAPAQRVWTVTTAEDPGPEGCAEVCSLRGAIGAANESDGGDLIRFSIDGSSVITLRSPLPALRGARISIDGRTQPGWSAERPPPVYLDGRQAGDAAGILVYGAAAEVRGLGIGGFQRYGIGVIGAGARDAVVESNWLGMSADGRGASPNRLSGVAVLGGAENARIGGGCAGCGNRIAGNSVLERTGHGVVVGGEGVFGAEVVGNTIGLDADGRPLANDDGVLVVDAAQAEVRGNVICASVVAGVEFRETRGPGAVDGNRIGVTAGGAPAGNDVGVFLGAGAARVKVGEAERNVVAANRVGIAVEQGAREVALQNNWIGLVPGPDSEAAAAAVSMPNHARGISIIAGAAEVRVVGNQVLAGDRGIVIAGADTSQVSLQRNAVASEGLGAVGIEAREASDVRIGGDRGLGNSVSGVGTGILLAEIEEAVVAHNRIGSEFAGIDFAADGGTEVGIELGAGVRAATVRSNLLGGMLGAGVSVAGVDARDNLITRNVFGRNGGLDIEVGAGVDAPEPPTLLSYEVTRISGNQLRNTIRGRGEPGTRVEIYVLGETRPGTLARGQVQADGTFEASTLLLAVGDIRGVSIARGGATSEFSESLPAPARQRIAGDGLRWVAVEGEERPPAEAFAALARDLEAAWRWDAVSGVWQGWSPQAPEGLATLRSVRGGEVVALQLGVGAPRDYFSTASVGGVGAALELRAGVNFGSWTGRWVDGWEALERLDREQPGLLSIVEQWDVVEERWRVIWPRVEGAWDPGEWGAPALRLRATRAGVWEQGW